METTTTAKDHERYMANREERKAKQREYYASHADYYRAYYKKRVQRERLKSL